MSTAVRRLVASSFMAWACAWGLPAHAGGERAPTGTMPATPAPVGPPQAPPAGLLPGPLGEAQRLEFDRLRTAGILHYRAGRFADAERYFRRALAIRPDDGITRAWLRAAREAQGKTTERGPGHRDRRRGGG